MLDSMKKPLRISSTTESPNAHVQRLPPDVGTTDVAKILKWGKINMSKQHSKLTMLTTKGVKTHISSCRFNESSNLMYNLSQLQYVTENDMLWTETEMQFLDFVRLHSSEPGLSLNEYRTPCKSLPNDLLTNKKKNRKLRTENTNLQ